MKQALDLYPSVPAFGVPEGITFAEIDVTNGRLANRYCPAVARETFLTGTEPPAWTSLVTGRGPGAHGIFDFFRSEPGPSGSIRFLTSRDVECPTLWSLASDAGLRSTVLNFPLTFPAPKIAGHVVSGGFMPWRQLRLGCHPIERRAAIVC